MKKCGFYILIAVLAFGAGIGITYAILNNASKESVVDKKDNYEKDSDQKIDPVKLNTDDLNYKLYPLLSSVNGSKVYQKNKVVASSFKDEKLVLSVSNYIALNHGNEIKVLDKFNGNSGVFYSISLDVINKYSNLLYGKTLKSLPKFVSHIYDQSAWLNYDESTNSMVFNLEFYEEKDTPSSILKSNFDYIKDMDVIYDKVEIDGSNIYVYDKTILNSEISWNVCMASISKLDGTGKLEIENICNIEDLYKKYPDYFTTYKHTFKIMTDGNYAYVSSEPVVR